jgi:hypothetical protein
LMAQPNNELLMAQPSILLLKPNNELLTQLNKELLTNYFCILHEIAVAKPTRKNHYPVLLRAQREWLTGFTKQTVSN